MPASDIIVIGASTGGVDAICELVQSLPKDLPAAVFVVLHIGPWSKLPSLLDRCGHLPAHEALDGEQIKNGQVYVAPPNHHLTVVDGVVRLSRGPRENRHRPAIDPLFRSAARAYRDRVTGVILTGALDDGTSGLYSIKQRGGITIIQDPDEAVASSMPATAAEYVEIDYCLPLKKIPETLSRLARKDLPRSPGKSKIENKMKTKSGAVAEKTKKKLVEFVCPECNGPMHVSENGPIIKYDCEVDTRFHRKPYLTLKAKL